MRAPRRPWELVPGRAAGDEDCDVCGGGARARVTVGRHGDLHLCAVHARAHAPALAARGYALWWGSPHERPVRADSAG